MTARLVNSVVFVFMSIASISGARLYSAVDFPEEGLTDSTDSIADRNLGEVTVEVKRERVSSGSATYLPTATVKSASQNAIDLLTRMAIPQILIDPIDNSVKTPSGLSVTVFINYLPATAEDMKGLRTADVKKVEVLDFPVDPRFQGAEHVVNIIVQEYEYGGYTKLTDSAFGFDGFTNQGQLYSKFSYRRMTYDVFFSPDYVNASNVGSAELQEFRLPSGDVIRDQQFSKSRFRYIDLPVSVRASYSHGGMRLVNTVGFDYFDRSRSESNGNLRFAPSLYPSETYNRDNPAINRTLTWNGNYFFAFRHGWSLNLNPILNYGHNNTISRYQSTEETITNDAREVSLYTRLNVNLTKRIGQHHSVFFNPSALYYRDKVNYLGDSPYQNLYENPFVGIGAGYQYSSPRLSGSIDAGVAGEFMSINAQNRNDWYPYLHVNATYAPDDRNQLTAFIQYATNSPDEADLSPNVIQQNELLYRTGNPAVCNSRHWTFSLGYTFLPVNAFSLSAYLYYFELMNRGVMTYSLYDDGRAVLRGYDNSGDYAMFQGSLTLTWRLLSNSLILRGGGAVQNFRSTGYYDMTRTPLYGNLQASYYWSNFNFSGYYQSRSHFMQSNSGAYSTTRDYYQLQAGWSSGPYNISVAAMNFFRGSNDGSVSRVTAPVFSSTTTSYSANYSRMFMLSATYTFGYGKKIDRSDEVSRATGSSSAIMQ